MKILIIGGTGTISSAITRQLVAGGHELWLINRGNRTAELPEGVKLVTGDSNNHPDEVVAKLGNEQFDAVWRGACCATCGRKKFCGDGPVTGN